MTTLLYKRMANVILPRIGGTEHDEENQYKNFHKKTRKGPNVPPTASRVSKERYSIVVQDSDVKTLPELAVSGMAQQNSLDDIKVEDNESDRRNIFNGLGYNEFQLGNLLEEDDTNLPTVAMSMLKIRGLASNKNEEEEKVESRKESRESNRSDSIDSKLIRWDDFNDNTKLAKNLQDILLCQKVILKFDVAKVDYVPGIVAVPIFHCPRCLDAWTRSQKVPDNCNEDPLPTRGQPMALDERASYLLFDNNNINYIQIRGRKTNYVQNKENKTMMTTGNYNDDENADRNNENRAIRRQSTKDHDDEDQNGRGIRKYGGLNRSKAELLVASSNKSMESASKNDVDINNRGKNSNDVNENTRGRKSSSDHQLTVEDYIGNDTRRHGFHDDDHFLTNIEEKLKSGDGKLVSQNERKKKKNGNNFKNAVDKLAKNNGKNTTGTDDNRKNNGRNSDDSKTGKKGRLDSESVGTESSSKNTEKSSQNKNNKTKNKNTKDNATTESKGSKRNKNKRNSQAGQENVDDGPSVFDEASNNRRLIVIDEAAVLENPSRSRVNSLSDESPASVLAKIKQKRRASSKNPSVWNKNGVPDTKKTSLGKHVMATTVGGGIQQLVDDNPQGSQATMRRGSSIPVSNDDQYVMQGDRHLVSERQSRESRGGSGTANNNLAGSDSLVNGYAKRGYENLSDSDNMMMSESGTVLNKSSNASVDNKTGLTKQQMVLRRGTIKKERKQGNERRKNSYELPPVERLKSTSSRPADSDEILALNVNDAVTQSKAPSVRVDTDSRTDITRSSIPPLASIDTTSTQNKIPFESPKRNNIFATRNLFSKISKIEIKPSHSKVKPTREKLTPSPKLSRKISFVELYCMTMQNFTSTFTFSFYDLPEHYRLRNDTLKSDINKGKKKDKKNKKKK